MEREPTLEEWMPDFSDVADEPQVPEMPKRRADKPFPAAKIWNHGPISRDKVEERLKSYAGNKSDGIFLARMKDKDSFSVGILFPGDAPPKFVLFEKKADGWCADKNYAKPVSATLAGAVELTLLDLGVPNADGVPKPE
jgi:hypothetical protein